MTRRRAWREQFGALRTTVSLLGGLLAEVVAEQESREVSDAIERVRRLAVRLRFGGKPLTPLCDLVETMGQQNGLLTARGFALYFHLVNVGEECHRWRVLRQRPFPLADSTAAALVNAESCGLRAEDVVQLLREITVEPVLTAHPTEARSRSVIFHLGRIRQLLQSWDEEDPIDDMMVAGLLEIITALWRTEDMQRDRPTPADEVRHGVAYLHESLFDAVPRLGRELHEAVGKVLGPSAPELDGFSPVRFSSWLGGDRDGNPAVTAEVTRWAADYQHEILLNEYQRELRNLAWEMSVSIGDEATRERLWDVLHLERDWQELSPFRPMIGNARQLVQYKIGWMAERLRRTRLREPGGYGSAVGFLEDLSAIDKALDELGLPRLAAGRLSDLRSRVAVFGFHFAALEIRQHRSVFEKALREALASGSWSRYDVERALTDQRLLAQELRLSRPLLADRCDLSRDARELFETLDAVRDIQDRFGREACPNIVISFTQSPIDISMVLILARESGLLRVRNGRPAASRIRVVPLFEQREDLKRAPEIMASLFADPFYRAHLALHDDHQEVMLGYSDSNKQIGYLSANWALYQAAHELSAVAREYGIALRLFHGRGGAIGRGGGPARRAILGQPPHSLETGFKLTEQGEVLYARYADPAIAVRHLDMLVAAILEARLELDSHGAGIAQAWTEEMHLLARDAMEVYRCLLDNDRFVSYLLSVTPILLIADLPIGSRPVSRGNPEDVEDLRAIPWTFAWTQTRHNLTGWYGIGYALERALADPERAATVRSMYQRWPYFASMIDTATVALATADRTVAHAYAQLADRDVYEAIWPLIEEEWDRADDVIRRLTDREDLLPETAFLRDLIARRNPYVDVLHVLQLVGLKRLRTGDESWRPVVAHAISGIAAGLQVTG
jgi:phosphoenolpyruvate carboxylase